MLKVFKLVNGEEIIGQVVSLNHEASDISLLNPMTILGFDDDSGFRLQNTLILAADNGILLPSYHILTCYNPSDSLANYYFTAVEYSNNYLKTQVNLQIQMSAQRLHMAFEEMKDKMSEQKKYFTQMMMGANNETKIQ